MKNFCVLVIILTSANAFATKARYRALNNSFHLVDTQSEFSSPYHIFSLKDFVSFETGLTGATSVDNGSEGLVKFSINDNSKMLIAIGHKDEVIQTQRKFMNSAAGTAFVTQQNPIEIIYGVKTEAITWAGGAFYSNFKDKTADNNETSGGLRIAASHGDFKWKINLGLLNKVQNVTSGTFNNKPFTNVGLRYGPGGNKFGLDYTTWKASRDSNGATAVELNSYAFENIKFQYVNTMAKDGEDFFYGIAIDSVKLQDKLNSNDLTRLAFPLWLGFEHLASEWLTIRASIKQTIYAQSKDDIGFPAGTIDGASGTLGTGSDYAGERNSTEVNAGLGFKFANFILDGTLVGSSGATANQAVNFTNFLGLVGMTYTF